MYLQTGDILRMANIYFLVKGNVLIKNKKDRKVVGKIKPQSIIC